MSKNKSLNLNQIFSKIKLINILKDENIPDWQRELIEELWKYYEQFENGIVLWSLDYISDLVKSVTEKYKEQIEEEIREGEKGEILQ